MPYSWSFWSSRSPYIPSFGISNKCSMLIFAVLASTLSSLVVVTRVSFSIVGLKVEAFWVYECLGVGRKRLEFTKIVKSFTSWGRRKFLKVFLDYEMTPVQILEGKCHVECLEWLIMYDYLLWMTQQRTFVITYQNDLISPKPY